MVQTDSIQWNFLSGPAKTIVSYCVLKVHEIVYFPSKFRQFRPQCFKILTQTLLLKKANDLSWEKFAELCGKWVNPVQDIFECGRRDLILMSIMKNQIWVLCRFKVGFCPFPVRFFSVKTQSANVISKHSKAKFTNLIWKAKVFLRLRR